MHQIPSVVLDGQQLILRNNGPHKIVGQSSRCKSEVKLDIILRSVLEVNESPSKLESPLEEVMTWPKSKDRVERYDIAPTGGEVEEIGIAIIRKSCSTEWF